MTNQSEKIWELGKVVCEFFVLLFSIIYFYAVALFRLIVKPDLKSLNGEVILITGGANGIGRETALLLSKCKAKIVCWDLKKNDNQRLVKELKDLGCQAYAFEVDVSDRQQVEAAAKQVQELVGDVTVLILNAGIMPCKTFLNHSPSELEKVFHVNVFGVCWPLRAFLPNMISLKKGHIVTLCSAAGLIPGKYLAPYCGTKHAVHAIIEGIKAELNAVEPNPNIHFTTIYPYSCSTGLLTGINSFSRFPWLIPKTLHPEDVAEKVVEGLRRNYEHVYLPLFVGVCGVLHRALHPKVEQAAHKFLQCYVEPKQQQKN